MIQQTGDTNTHTSAGGCYLNKTLKILTTDLKEIYISFKEELPNWTKSQKWR